MFRDNNDATTTRAKTMTMLIELLETVEPLVRFETLGVLFVSFIGYAVWTTCVDSPRQYFS